MLKNKVEELVDKYLDEVISIRRYLHQNPELSLKEFNTAEFIVKELNKIGLDAQRGRENNGVVSNLNLGKGTGSGIFSIIASFNYIETYLEHFVLNETLHDMDYYMKYVCWDSIVTRYLEELIYPYISE